MRPDPWQRLRVVNPFLGVDEPGNCLCGPYLPFGSVRPGPDIVLNQARGATNGYRTGKPIRHFSQVHVSGTGGGGRYGNIAIMPGSDASACPPASKLPRREEAFPGYYAVTLDPGGIRVEITATRAVAVYRFSFSSGSPTLFVDAAAALLKGGECLEAGVTVEGAQCLSGQVRLLGGWGHAQPYAFFFFLECSSPWTSVDVDAKNLSAACLRFSGSANPLEVRIGVSRSSVAQARTFLQNQASAPFDTIRKRAEDVWMSEIQRFDLEGEAGDIAMFDAMLHRLYAMPSDLGSAEEQARWSSGTRPYDDFFCLWDSCRNANSFYHLFRPDLSSRFANSWLDVAEHTGWLPDAWISQHHGFMQGGCSVDLILSEAIHKGVPGIDARQALTYMRKNAEEESPDPDFYGRYLGNHTKLGYVTPDETAGCVSRQIEYALHDRCIARLAEHVGESKLAEHYEREAAKIWNLWHPEKLCFFPKDSAGRWVDDFDIRFPSRPPEEGHYSSDPYFFEGTALEWSFCATHVLPELIHRIGGLDAWTQRLQRFLDHDLYAWKEIILHTPYLFHYAGRPDLSAHAVRRAMRRYRNTPDGLPDNEDMGSHTSFWILSALGLYPVMGQLHYLITPPLFESVRVPVGPEQREFRLIREGPADGVIVHATWNGDPHPANWIHHRDLIKGGTMRLLTRLPAANWGTPPPGNV